jgi:hypothetical protein
MNKVKQLGYYAKDKDGNLHQFEWGDNDAFGIYNTTTKEYVQSNADDYEILEVGYYHNEN